MSEWLNLAFRWFHVVAGVLWIGQTAFFAWLDSRMTVEAGPDGREQVWMVHSGGFYVVDKQQVPELLPRTLHWFKWESAATWASGFLLLVVVYYLGGALVDPASGVSVGLATAVGVALLPASWIVYDLLWKAWLERRPALGAALGVVLCAAVAWGLTGVMGGRAAYIHVGAMLGTLMAANVWVRILPAQRQLIAAAREGRTADPELAARAKRRSSHNTFLAIPVIFIMISSHFPTASYGHRWNWAMLAGFVVAGFAARGLMNLWNRKG